MWADNEAVVDFLNVDYLAAGVLATVRNDRLLPVTLGVFGDWGSGKSTVLRMVQRALEEDKETLVVFFNGWQFEGYDDARTALMGSILDEMQDRKRIGEKVKDIAQRLLKRVNWFRLMGLVGGAIVTAKTGIPTGIDGAVALAKTLPGSIDLETAKALVKEAPEDENPRRAIREFRKDFEELLKGSNIRRLVVIIDDLDRCLPSTLIATLEAIRLFLLVERTAFIIGADEDLVRHAVRLRFPGAVRGTKEDVGEQYLEKLIQVPVRVPTLGRFEVELYMALLFCELHLGPEDVREVVKKLPPRTASSATPPNINRTFIAGALQRAINYIPSQLEDDLAVAAQVGEVLSGGLRGNPRFVKRFLNALLLRTHMAEARKMPLRRRELAKLMLLERLRPGSFAELAGWPRSENGSAPILGELERRARGASNIESSSTEAARQPTTSDSTPDEAEDDEPTESATTISESPAAHWLEDEWLANWLRLDPMLANVDLRDYIFFARESIGALTSSAAQMSPKARQALQALLSPAKATQASGLTATKALSPVEAGQILEHLAHQARVEENSGKSSPVTALVQLASARSELANDVVSVLESLPHTRIPSSVPPRLLQLASGSPAVPRARALVERWESSPHPSLARASKHALGMVESKGRPPQSYTRKGN